MRIISLVIAIFLWGIWFAVADMNYVGEFMGSPEQNFIGWGGLLLIIMAAIFLFIDWFKKSAIKYWLTKKIKASI